MGNKVPIYSVPSGVEKEFPRTMNMPFSWWKPMCTLAQMPDIQRQNALSLLESDSKMADILQDFVSIQTPYKSLMQEWFDNQEKKTLSVNTRKRERKTPRRGSKSVLRMKERKEQRQKKQYNIKEFETNGEKHYL